MALGASAFREDYSSGGGAGAPIHDPEGHLMLTMRHDHDGGAAAADHAAVTAAAPPIREDQRKHSLQSTQELGGQAAYFEDHSRGGGAGSPIHDPEGHNLTEFHHRRHSIDAVDRAHPQYRAISGAQIGEEEARRLGARQSASPSLYAAARGGAEGAPPRAQSSRQGSLQSSAYSAEAEATLGAHLATLRCENAELKRENAQLRFVNAGLLRDNAVHTAHKNAHAEHQHRFVELSNTGVGRAAAPTAADHSRVTGGGAASQVVSGNPTHQAELAEAELPICECCGVCAAKHLSLLPDAMYSHTRRSTQCTAAHTHDALLYPTHLLCCRHRDAQHVAPVRARVSIWALEEVFAPDTEATTLEGEWCGRRTFVRRRSAFFGRRGVRGEGRTAPPAGVGICV